LANAATADGFDLEGRPMTFDDLTSRVRRLEELGRGLSKEVMVVQKADDPLLYLERRAYLKGIQDALAGIEDARVTLARACQRLGAEEGPAAT
jgi:hypothetical protein